jgi:prolyl-tRNA synthetase
MKKSPEVLQNQSKLFCKTIRETPKDIDTASHAFLIRGGFIRESVAGRYYFLPIGYKIQQKIMAVVREEMDIAGAQEMLAPILHPLELWEETNRTNTTGFELMKVKDRRGAEFALGGTAEEMFVDLIRKFKLSYKDLPFQLYQFSPKFRDEIRARGGLLRVREFIMKDGYSFHRDEEDFKIEYEKMKVVYTKIFNNLGLKTTVVESDNGYIGGEYCHEFIVESEVGESKYFVSEDQKYAAHEDVAKFKKEDKNKNEKLAPMEEVGAARGVTMEDGVKFHNLPLWQQIKDVLFVDEQGRFVLAVIRGDFDVNEIKLKNLVKATTLRHATDEEIREKINSEPGFISPVNIKNNLGDNVNLVVIADDSLRTIVNAYGGSNKKNIDLLNVNIDRDYMADMEGDVALAKVGYEALGGEGKLIEKRGIEVGNIFQLGYHYSNKMKGAIYIDEDGKEKPFYMGCYGIGIGRTMATIVEKYHDEKGIIWPVAVAPYDVHVLSLKGGEDAEKIALALSESGLEVLFDDREDSSAGEKFADSEIIGIPVQVIVSERGAKDGIVEIRKRNNLAEAQKIERDNNKIINAVSCLLSLGTNENNN